jgi:hypothetical protein
MARAGPGLAAVLVCAGVAACGGRPEPASYVDEIVSARIEKDRFFRDSAESPVPAAARDRFLPLSYFSPDPEYKVPAVFKPAGATELVRMPTSTGKIRDMRRAGTLEFGLKGRPLRLTAFTDTSGPPTRLFVPFSDLTTGTETYAAGRYLDLDRMASGIYEIDFNRAYHPYCYYDERYDCPYPPSENRLKVPVRAGERLPGH